MALTSIDLNQDKVDEVKRITGSRSNREAVDAALDAVINNSRFDPSRMAAIANTQHGETIAELADR